MHGPLPAPGELVWIRHRRWRVERARRDRGVVRLDVANRGLRLTLLAPFDRVSRVSRLERVRRVRPQHAIARLAGLIARSHGFRTILAAVDAKIAILPHQLEPALAILDGARRVLLADEVGLGKTIQAGLVIAEVMRRQPAPRVLVVVPGALIDQWTSELRDRFGIDGLAVDRRRLDEEARTGARGDNPWGRSGVRIASLDYIKQPHVLDALPAEPWDLLVIDEAHAACGDSERHQACERIAGRSRQALLLTATPHDGDAARFARLVHLGAQGDDDRMLIFRRTRAQLTMPAARRIRWHYVKPTPSLRRLLHALLLYERTVLDAAAQGQRNAACLLLSVFRKRALSTMTALVTTLQRRLTWLDAASAGTDPTVVQPRLDFEEREDELDDSELSAIRADVGFDCAHERTWLRRLLILAETARREDPKIDRIATLLQRSREPVVVFTEFRHSLTALEHRVATHQSVAVLHGGQTPAQRRHELNRFLKGAAAVLIATDVASLGLNLQHRARWVINLDLPWNPLRLEQRAGRVDRIGQTRPVHITLMIARHEAETLVIGRLAQRTLTARQALGHDVLAVVPTPDRVRECVLTSTPVGETIDGCVLPLCRTWVRSGRAAAAVLEKRRRLAAHWHGPVCLGAAAWSAGRRAPLARFHEAPLLVFSVPIVDRFGAVVEQRVVPIALGDSRLIRRPSRAVIEAARRAAAASLSARAVRVSRSRRAVLAKAGQGERRLSARIVSERLPTEIQPGLFDRRQEQAFAESRKAADELSLHVDGRLEVLEDSADVIVGPAVLVLVVNR